MVEVLKDAGWASLFVFGAFAGLGKLASLELKRSAAHAIQSADPAAVGERWSDQAAGLLDGFFGKKHLSWRCFGLSAFVSIISVALLDKWFGTISLWLDSTVVLEDVREESRSKLYGGALILAFIFNVVPDYVSVLESRWALGRLRKARAAFSRAGWIVIDAVMTALVFIVWLFGCALVVVGDDVSTMLLVILGSMEFLPEIFGVFFLSTFITSVWLWLYALSLPLARFLRSLHGPLGFVRNLDVDGKPFQVLGAVAAVLTFTTWVAIGAVWKVWG